LFLKFVFLLFFSGLELIILLSPLNDVHFRDFVFREGELKLLLMTFCVYRVNSFNGIKYAPFGLNVDRTSRKIYLLLLIEIKWKV